MEQQEPSRTRLAVPREVLALVIIFTVLILIYRSVGPGSKTAFGGNYEHMAIARSVVNGYGFANPFGYTTGPTAAYTPVHPLMVAAILFLLGNRPPAALALVLTEVAIQTACVVLLLYIAAAAFASWIPGAIAAGALLLCTWPLPQWESSTVWLAFEAVFLCALMEVPWGWTGAVMGLGWLVSPALGPASLAVVWLLRGRKYLIASVAIAMIVIAPWAARNWLVMRAPIFCATISAWSCSSRTTIWRGRARTTPRRSAISDGIPAATQRWRRIWRESESRNYFSRMQSEALDWMRSHPARFLQLTIARIWMWWASSWVVAAISLLAFVGLWFNRRTTAGKAALAGLLIFPLPYYVIQFNPRYAYPVLWLAALMAGDVCFRLVRRVVPAKAF